MGFFFDWNVCPQENSEIKWNWLGLKSRLTANGIEFKRDEQRGSIENARVMRTYLSEQGDDWLPRVAIKCKQRSYPIGCWLEWMQWMLILPSFKISRQNLTPIWLLSLQTIATDCCLATAHFAVGCKSSLLPQTTINCGKMSTTKNCSSDIYITHKHTVCMYSFAFVSHASIDNWLDAKVKVPLIWTLWLLRESHSIWSQESCLI